MQFSLGKPILVLLFAAAISAIAVWKQPPLPRADLVLWSFDETHARTFRDRLPDGHGRIMPSLVNQFERRLGLRVRISLIGEMGENIRLASAFMAQAGPQSPDLCEIEIHSIGQFLRPPNDDIGLLPLNDFLRQSGWGGRIMASRFAPWSKIDPRTGRRIIYGIPADVHPVTITYRKDLFDEAGINLDQAKTWREFQDMCLAFQKYWATHGHRDRKAIALSTGGPDEIVEMLLQRHINLIDHAQKLHFTDPELLDTAIFYAQLIAGPRAIGADVSPGIGWTEDLARGNVCAVCTPDWKAAYLRQFSPQLAGKVRMMPMPKFESSDAPTSTSGGTMIGICRSCPHPRQAWKLLEFLYLSPEAAKARLAAGDDVLPAIPEYWNQPIYHQRDPFFADGAGGQRIGNLYINLAEQIPERFVTPYTYQAELALVAVLHRAEEYIADHGTAEGLTQPCAAWLAEAQDDMQRRIDFGKFEP
ncbi:MAG TPA: extracellular solute-binding protein [Tepidisphaeraceae bacterium]|nr:extracellular solute-binding protein [Tepidisphaeraceae bacterium]